MKKIIISFLCGLAFIAPSVLSASLFFSDIKLSDWFYADVKSITDMGIIKGNTDGTFAPGKNVNRAELATILSRYENYISGKLANINNPTTTTTTASSDLVKRVEALEKKDADILQATLKNDALFFNNIKKDVSMYLNKHHEFINKNLVFIREIEPGEMYDSSYLLPYNLSLSEVSCKSIKDNLSSQKLQSSAYEDTIKTVGCK